MKIIIDPMSALRTAARETVNSEFNGHALRNVHRLQAHRRKREIAGAVLAGTENEAFAEEASLRSLAVIDLAHLILSKADPGDASELERQRKLLAIDASRTPFELEAILTGTSK